MADKSNAMKHAHELWHRCFFEVAKEYPGIEAKHVYVDALCLYLVQDPSPFEVIVTNNLFGDIVTDLGAALQGGLGMAASANVHAARSDARRACSSRCTARRRRSPARTSRTRSRASSPSGMMLAHLGWPEEERASSAACPQAIDEGEVHRDVGGKLGTRAAARLGARARRAEL